MDVAVINKFDIKKIKNNSSIVLIGKSRTGKSFLIRDILYNKRDIKDGLIISNRDLFNSGILQNVLEHQKKAKKEGWKKNKDFFLVMDDCVSDTSVLGKDRSMKEILLYGRHYKIHYLLSLQNPMGLTPLLICDTDYLFIHKTEDQQLMYQIFDKYTYHIFDNFKTFKYFLERCTQNNCVMVINKATASTNIEDVVFFYKAEAHDDFISFYTIVG